MAGRGPKPGPPPERTLKVYIQRRVGIGDWYNVSPVFTLLEKDSDMLIGDLMRAVKIEDGKLIEHRIMFWE